MRQMTLEQAARLIGNDQIVTIGGTLSQRIPAAMVRELARRGVKGLHLVKPSPGFDADVLVGGGCLASVRAGMTTLEQPFGMAPNFRRAAERGEVNVIENACPAVMASLQAAAFGLPFQAVAGFAEATFQMLRRLRRFKIRSPARTHWLCRRSGRTGRSCMSTKPTSRQRPDLRNAGLGSPDEPCCKARDFDGRENRRHLSFRRAA